MIDITGPAGSAILRLCTNAGRYFGKGFALDFELGRNRVIATAGDGNRLLESLTEKILLLLVPAAFVLSGALALRADILDTPRQLPAPTW